MRNSYRHAAARPLARVAGGRAPGLACAFGAPGNPTGTVVTSGKPFDTAELVLQL
jgi:hypothetical protein